MSALKYWNGTGWVILPDIGAKQVWTGPDAPVPIGDHRLWIDTDEPDPALVGSNAWQSNGVGVGVAHGSTWAMLPLPTAFTQQGDVGAFTRNADGSLTVRDAGVYSISATAFTGGGASARRQVRIIRGTDVNAAGVELAIDERDNSSTGTGQVPVAAICYLSAGQIISIYTWSETVPTGVLRFLMVFGIARVGTGPAGPPGPPGPGGIIDTQRLFATGSGYKAGGGGLVYGDLANTIPMRLSYTPPVACWWEVHAHMGAIQKLSAEYSGGYLDLRLNQADIDGFQVGEHYEIQHSTVQSYAFRSPTVLFKLAAGVAYSCEMQFYGSPGTWQYGITSSLLWMFGKAWAR